MNQKRADLQEGKIALFFKRKLTKIMSDVKNWLHYCTCSLTPIHYSVMYFYGPIIHIDPIKKDYSISIKKPMKYHPNLIRK